jgi:cytochrome P450
MIGRDDPASARQMAVTDPPRHTRLRRALGRPIRMRAMAEHAPRMRDEVSALLAPAVAGEVFDIAAAMMSLSTAVAGLVMGLPPDDWPELTYLVTMAIAPDDPDYAQPGGREATLEYAHRELFAYFHEKAVERQEHPGPDVISVLHTIRFEDGRPLSVGDVVANCYSMLMGASVTSPHVPSSTLLELIEHDRYREWAAHPQLLSHGIEESLRWASPANHFMRCATRDVRLRDKSIRAGEAVVVWIGAADRDPEVFRDPYRLDPGRVPNQHVAFGAGPHYCVGHHAARQMLGILFRELTSTFADFTIEAPAEHLCSNFVAGIKHLKLRGVPRGRG